MRFSWVPLVVVAVAVGGWIPGHAMAQEPEAEAPEVPSEAPSQAPPPELPSTAGDTSTAGQVLQSLRDFGAFGASAGGMLFLADDDASRGAKIRPSLQGVFRYRFGDDWVGVGEFGFGWNAYEGKGDTVLTVTSGTLGVYRRVMDLVGLDLRAGAGAGFYRWNYKFEGKSIRDARTQLPLRAISPGVFGALELERRLTPHVTVLVTGQTHYLLSSNEEDFPSYLGGNDAFVTARFGVNYHFSPYQGILWQRKETRVIRLESGQAGS